MDIKVAVLVDGSFYINRLQYYKRRYYAEHPELTPAQAVKVLTSAIMRHVKNGSHNNYHHLYRIYYYDSPPLGIKAHYPLRPEGHKTTPLVDFSKEPKTVFRLGFLEELKKQKKLALRLGTVKHDKQWKLTDLALNDLLKGARQFNSLTNDDFYYNSRQKGVDIKLGIDIATLSLNKLIDKIILMAGDSDFVPAAKLARTNGVDFVLDALRNNIDPGLYEHIDGLVNFDLVAIMKEVLGVEPDKTPEWWDKGSNPQPAKGRNQRRPHRK